MKNQIKEFLDQLPPEYDEYVKSITELHQQRDDLLRALKKSLAAIDWFVKRTNCDAPQERLELWQAIAAAEEGK